LIHVNLKGKMSVFRIITPRKTLLIASQLIKDIPDAVKEHGSDPSEILSITKTDQFLDVVILPEYLLVGREEDPGSIRPGGGALLDEIEDDRG